MTEPSRFDDQELAGGYRHTQGPPLREEEGRGQRICRHEHRRIRVTWNNGIASNATVYCLCLECNMLYTQDWDGGGTYDPPALLRYASPVVQETARLDMVRRFFYRGWPVWWLERNGLSVQDVDLSIEMRNEGG